MTLSLELGNVSDPGARRALEQVALQWPAVPLFFRDDGAGNVQLVVRFPSGVTQVIATEP